MNRPSNANKHVLVSIRTRPTTKFAQDEIIVEPNERRITVKPPAGHVFARSTAGGAYSGKEDGTTGILAFQYDSVLHNTRQDTVYGTVGSSVVQNVVNGISGAIIAYGQTGAGKTFTMIGDTNNYVNRGICPRAIAHIFQEIDSRPEMEFTLDVSYMEIYNDRIHDLLKPENAKEPEYVLGEDPQLGTIVKGLSMHRITSEQEALNALFTGELHRTIAQHQLNRASNRSHCIFTIYMKQRSRVGLGEKSVYSKLHLVDLAGSERLKKTMSNQSYKSDSNLTDQTLTKESMFINKSLSYLEQCVVALTRRDFAHIPFRQTRLTNVLKDALNGASNVAFVACIWGEHRHLEETISTLRLAARMRKVNVSAHESAIYDPNLLVKKYERQIIELKQELAMHNALAERHSIQYDEYTPEEKHTLRSKLRMYVDATTPEEENAAIQLESVRQMREILAQAKLMIREAEIAQREAIRASSSTLQDMPSLQNQTQEKANSIDHTNRSETTQTISVNQDRNGGQLESQGGVGIGLADATSRPKRSLVGPLRHSSTAASKIQSPNQSPNRDHTNIRDNRRMSINEEELPTHINIQDVNQCYRWYRTQGPGTSIGNQLLELKRKFNTLRKELKQQADSINSAKATLDSLQQNGTTTEEMTTSYKSATSYMETKKKYKQAYTQWTQMKQEMKQIDEQTIQLQAKLLQTFDTWYYNESGVHAAGISDMKTTLSLPNDTTKHEERNNLNPSTMFALSSPIRNMNQTPDTNGFSPNASILTVAGAASASASSSPANSRLSRPMNTSTISKDFSTTAAALAGFSLSDKTHDTTFQMSNTGQFGDEIDDGLDEGEAFEKMEMERVATESPDCLAYYHARKQMHSTLREARTTGAPLHGKTRRLRQ